MQGFDGLGCDEHLQWCIGEGNAMDGHRRGPQTVRDSNREESENLRTSVEHFHTGGRGVDRVTCWKVSVLRPLVLLTVAE